MNPRLAPGCLTLAALAGSALAQPSITYLPASPSLQIIGLQVSQDGNTVAGFVGGNSSFIWRRNQTPQITNILAQGNSGPFQSIAGMNAAGTRFLIPYRDPAIVASPTYPGGLVIPSIYENETYTRIAPPAIAAGCDQSIVSSRALTGDGQTIAASVWNTCRVAPFTWNAATGWSAWATLPTFAPFGQSGYQSHQIVAISADGTTAAGWFQSGTGYGGRTAVIWTNSGQTIQRLDAAGTEVFWGQATAVSDNGRFVAGAGVPAALVPDDQENSQDYLYRWTQTGGVEVLGRVNIGSFTRSPNVAGISRNGRIIAGQHAFGFDRDAFIWTPQRGAESLTDYLLAKGLDLSQDFITLTSVAGMSGDGRYLTGQWADLGGSRGPFVLDLGPQACNEADQGSEGGAASPDYILDNNDFIVFIDRFFSADPAADLGTEGGAPGTDGTFDNNDFIVFIQFFFQGC
jgi:hypothetical protein